MATLVRNTAPPDQDPDLTPLVGVPCPGCGSPFQIDRPQDSGYLTKAVDTTNASESISEKKSKKSTQPAFDPDATSMTHTQYEEHLKTLDPKILEEMGVILPAAPSPTTDESSEQRHPGKEGPEVREEVEEVVEMLTPIPKHIETLAQSKTATVVLVVDLIDFPLSLPQPIIDELLKPKARKHRDSKEYPTTPIILVGNKFDVMPLGTLRHKVIQRIQRYLDSHGLSENIRAIHLVSAKNPAGDEIRLLLKSIGTSWDKSGRKGNIVMVGAENVGKSQLLNAFLRESGRWRPNNTQIQRARYGSEQLERQRKLSALLGDVSSSTTESEGDKEWATLTGKDSVGQDIDQYETVYKDRGLEKLYRYQTTVSNVPGTTLEKIKVPLSVLSRFMGATFKEVQTKWLMDTPGVRDDRAQLTSWLTLEELNVSLPKKMLKPASFMLEEGKSFFLGGLVRIDCISIGKKPTDSTLDASASASATILTDSTATHSGRQRGSNPVPKITVFTTLPLHKTSTAAADKFLERTAKGDLTVLQPPFGSKERLLAFPGLAPVSDKDIVIINQPYPTSSSSYSDPFAKLEGAAKEGDPIESILANMTRQERENTTMQLAGQYGISDLVFSGIGWVMVSGKFRGEQQAVTLRVWTPRGEGAMVREMCLLPELAANPVEKTAGGIRQKQKLFRPLPPKVTKAQLASGAGADVER
ncbi:hypothetical protein BC939DRAFT_524825 [Gamsiella multidivaricata]|uniref:uncharacterized protein n=1 Tax=Gamsiella multidivaricata TaxID=101098 RepID=UPI002220AB10|nr:uncharacterized protein BC939DRAFT_524825 [Gamsiella multidivaricata]KAI7831691.1 hypothetical protein BC939DRAFT_524825 [Gamsiella multidivaricata]